MSSGSSFFNINIPISSSGDRTSCPASERKWLSDGTSITFPHGHCIRVPAYPAGT